MYRINPFKPNLPVNPGMFVGRIEEILRLESYLRQAKAGNPVNFIITGERGIGKSSLMLYVQYIAKGLLDVEGAKFKFLVVDTDIDKNTTQLALLQKIEMNLRRALGDSEPARKLMSDIWSFLKRIETSAIKLGESSVASLDETTMEEFAYSLADTCNRICDADIEASPFSARFDGIIILIDEADNAPPELQTGSFFKLLLERLQRRGCNNVMIGLAGLPRLRDVIQKSHPSALRLFEVLNLDRLSTAEVKSVIDKCLEKANSENVQPTRITNDAKQSLVNYSEGYPHFIQQYGYSAFKADNDGLIDDADVTKGAFGKDGALELIGDRYYKTHFYQSIQKDSYRQVLRIMANHLDQWVKRQEIKREFKGKESVLNNAIKALRDRRIIISKEGERGVYRLEHKGFAIWIKFCTEAPPDLQRTLGVKQESNRT